ncbi:MAG TPA: tyrosine-type recombinase/integrase [Egibacteraceae bacterium]|nr:tyrosine-type recombinase/integrase [Egibacteraceae bacterium]
MSGPSSSELAARYIDDSTSSGRVASNSAGAMRSVLRRFVDASGDPAASKLTDDHIRSWLDSQSAVSDRTRRTNLATLKTWCRWMKDQGYISRDPTERVKLAYQPRPRRGPVAVPTGRSALVLGEYRDHQERSGFTPKTITGTSRLLRYFAVALEPKDVLDAKKRDIEAWLDGRRLSPKSRYTYISTIASFYDWAVDEELLAQSPTRRIRRPRTGRALPRPADDGDLARALRGATPRMRAWLMLGAYQGLRCHEIALLQVDDLLLTRRPPLLVVSHGKGGRERVLPLNPQVEAALRAYGLPRSGYIFTSDGTRPLVAESVSNTICRYLRLMGGGATAHQLRHWFGSAVYQRTRDLRLTQELMGHAFPSTTAIYAAWDTEAAGDVVRSLGAPDEE